MGQLARLIDFQYLRGGEIIESVTTLVLKLFDFQVPL